MSPRSVVVAASQRSPPRVVNMVARPKRSIPAALSSASAVHSAASTGCSEKPRTDGLDCLRFRDSSWATTYAFFIPSTGCVPASTSSMCHTRATPTIASTGIHDTSRSSTSSSHRAAKGLSCSSKVRSDFGTARNQRSCTSMVDLGA